jgi:hypothetical protein
MNSRTQTIGESIRLEAASAHAIAAHGHADTPELRKELRALLRTEPD